MARDPVCGMEIDEQLAEDLGAERLEWQGQVYYFCCPYCRDAFAREPERYLKEGPDPHHAHGA